MPDAADRVVPKLRVFKGPKYPKALTKEEKAKLLEAQKFHAGRHGLKAKNPAVRLLAVADAFGVRVEHVYGPEFQAALAHMGLTKLKEDTITHAKRLEHDSREKFKQAVWDLGGTVNGRKNPAVEQALNASIAGPPSVTDSGGKPKRRRRKGEAVEKPPKAPKPEGPSNKETVYKLWIKSKKKLTPEQLLKQTKAPVKITTVKSWVGSWAKEKNLPAFAKKGK